MSSVTTSERPTAAPTAPDRSAGRRRLARRESLFGFGMIAVAVTFVGAFTALPILASFGLSFFSWDVISSPEFVGLENYQRLVTDSTVVESFGVTLSLGISIVIIQLALGLFLAVLVNQRRRKSAKTFFRTAFYLPLLASTAAVAIFMGYMFDYRFGVVTTTSA